MSTTRDQTEQQGEGVERIADPEDYNLRRRLKQLHDSKEFVLQTKRQAIREHNHGNIGTIQRDRLVAEAVVDYLSELVTVLEQSGDLEEFMEETVTSSDGELRVETYLSTRGTEGDRPRSYADSMAIWQVANRYFELRAGVEFESGSLPKEEGFQTVNQ